MATINEKLKEKLSTLTKLNTKEWELVENYFEEVDYKKKATVLDADRTAKYIYFIAEGSLRVFFEEDEHDYSIDFGFEGDFICAFTSFLTQQPSKVSIQAIEKTKVLRIARQDLYKLYDLSPSFERLGRVLIEQHFVQKMSDYVSMMSQPATTRYKNLIKKTPQVVTMLPVKYVASYLGIHSESLSRIRRNVAMCG
ncbi:MAG: Crp/Fnr family transcriptional regulator [Aureispira sp.]|nr:Crp/Fnr family transcriptional regulator [Aureispira sp.]